MRFATRPSLRRFASRFRGSTERHRSRTCLASGYDPVLVLKTSGSCSDRSRFGTASHQVPVFNYGMQPVVTGSL
jgi:hypothetical protein